MSEIGQDRRYRGYPLFVKYMWIKDQPGIAAVEAASTNVKDMGTKLGETTTATNRAMRGLGVSWAGPASDAAQRSSAQLTVAAEGTQQLTTNGAGRIVEYGRSFETLRPRVAYEDMSHLGWTDFVFGMEPARIAHDLMPWTADQDKLSPVTRNMDLDEEANRALDEHAARARLADDAFATAGVDPPPAPAVGGGEQSAGSGGAGGGGSLTSSNAPPTVSAASTAPPVAAAPPSASPVSPAAPVGGQPSTGGPLAAPVATPSSTTGGAGTRTGPGAAGGRIGADRPGAGVGSPGGGGANVGTGPTSAAGALGRADPAQAREQLGRQFGRDLTAGAPGARTGSDLGYGGAGRVGGPVAGLAPGARSGSGPYGRTPGSGSSFGRGYGGTGSGSTGSGAGWRGTLGEPSSRLPAESGGRGWSRGIPGEGTAGRPAAGEPTTGRSGGGYGPGYAPMMGAAGGGRGDGDAHRNRYLLPSSEPFDVDLPHSPPVLGPDEEDPA